MAEAIAEAETEGEAELESPSDAKTEPSLLRRTPPEQELHTSASQLGRGAHGHGLNAHHAMHKAAGHAAHTTQHTNQMRSGREQDIVEQLVGAKNKVDDYRGDIMHVKSIIKQEKDKM